MPNYLNRVAVYAPSGALLFMAPSTQASDIVDGGGEVWSIRGGVVRAVRMTEGQALRTTEPDGVRPGSYGIKREHLPDSGRMVYGHKHHWGEELEAQ